jgi:hypothetical protein
VKPLFGVILLDNGAAGRTCYARIKFLRHANMHFTPAPIGRRTRSASSTWIELLVVIALIPLLNAMLVPALSKEKDRSESIDCRTT